MSVDFDVPVTQEILTAVSKLDRLRGQCSASVGVPSERLECIREAANLQSVAASCRLSGMPVSENHVAAVLRGDVAVSDAKSIRGYAASLAFPFPGPERVVESGTLAELNATILQNGDLNGEHEIWRQGEMNREAFDGDGHALGWIFPTLPPRMIPEKTEDMLSWLELELRSGQRHPVMIIGTFMLGFLAISPFSRGNGRTSRALVRHLMVRAGYEHITLASIENELEANRSAYLHALFQARTGIWSGTADLQSWIEFFVAVLDRNRERVETKLALERGALEFPPLQREILGVVREHGSVNASLLLEATGANRNTLKDNLRRLVDRGVLEKTGQKRGTRYRLPAGDAPGSVH